MELNSDVKNVLFTGLGAMVATAIGAIPKAWRGMRKDIGDAAVRRQQEILEAEKRARLELRIEQLAGDLQGVADMVRKRFEDADKALARRFEKLKLKDNALESLLTGEVPRISGETEAVNG